MRFARYKVGWPDWKATCYGNGHAWFGGGQLEKRCNSYMLLAGWLRAPCNGEKDCSQREL